jgi:hypothetical protein
LSSALKRELELRRELKKEMDTLSVSLASSSSPVPPTEAANVSGDGDVPFDINDEEVAKR